MIHSSAGAERGMLMPHFIDDNLELVVYMVLGIVGYIVATPFFALAKWAARFPPMVPKYTAGLMAFLHEATRSYPWHGRVPHH